VGCLRQRLVLTTAFGSLAKEPPRLANDIAAYLAYLAEPKYRMRTSRPIGWTGRGRNSRLSVPSVRDFSKLPVPTDLAEIPRPTDQQARSYTPHCLHLHADRDGLVSVIGVPRRRENSPGYWRPLNGLFGVIGMDFYPNTMPAPNFATKPQPVLGRKGKATPGQKQARPCSLCAAVHPNKLRPAAPSGYSPGLALFRNRTHHSARRQPAIALIGVQPL
jgi:hypothetical protein